MPVSGQTYLDIVFASGGSVTAVPDATQGDGSVSFTQGYGANYTIPQGSPGVLNVEEVKMNYLFNLITTVLQQYQQQTIAPFISSTANNGSAYSYSKYSLAMYTNGIAYISLVNSNTVLPGSDSTKWQPITLGTGLVAANNLSDVVSASTSLLNLSGAPLASPVFTGTPTAPTASAGTNTTQIATTAAIQNSIIGGAAQTWQNVSGSRVAGTTYYNTTSRPILVNISAGVGNGVVDLYINSIHVASATTVSSYSNNEMITGIVPVGGSYYLAGSPSVGVWAELR